MRFGNSSRGVSFSSDGGNDREVLEKAIRSRAKQVTCWQCVCTETPLQPLKYALNGRRPYYSGFKCADFLYKRHFHVFWVSLSELLRSWQCKVTSFSLPVVARAIAYMNEFQS